MISFTELSPLNKEKLAEKCAREIAGADIEEITDIIFSFCELCEDECDTCVAISHYGDCLLARIFDMGRYSFVYPIALTDTADAASAVNEIRLYAMKEEIPLVITDVPAECLGELVSSFRYSDVSAEDAERSSYRVHLKNECDLLEEIPYFEHGALVFDEITDDDAEAYAALCRDLEVNKYWGYDYRADMSSPEDSYFVDNARSEFYRGASVTLAVRYNGKFIGEATLYAFDFLGAAECGFRIAKEYQGCGFGRATLEALIKIAQNVGLIELRATVMKENLVSVNLVSSVLDEYSRNDGKIYFKTVF